MTDRQFERPALEVLNAILFNVPGLPFRQRISSGTKPSVDDHPPRLLAPCTYEERISQCN
jgi:hypothetical protein